VADVGGSWPVLDEVVRELAENTMPAPEDVLCEVGVLARVYYVEQMVYELLRNLTAMASEDVGTENEAPASVVSALQAVAEGCGSLDVACVALGILPPEALPK
jgi:hypothetical protein